MRHRKAPRDVAFDKLVGAYYGGPPRGSRHPATTRWLPGTAEELLGGYYGKPRHHHPHHHDQGHHHDLDPDDRHGAQHRHAHRPDRTRGPGISLESSVDDGETLRSDPRGSPFEEYVVSASLSEPPFEEYVVDRVPMGADLATATSLGDGPADPQGEWQVDVLDPLSPAAPAIRRADDPPAVTLPPRPEPPAALRGTESPQSLPPMATHLPPPSGPSDDDFISDMQSILGGTHVWDPGVKKAVPKGTSTQASTPPPPSPPAATGGGDGNGQAIFDKIAAHLKYANAYDLGTVELENRFSSFDREFDEQRNAQRTKRDARGRARPGSEREAPRADVSTEDFLADLDALQRTAVAPSAAIPVPADAGRSVAASESVAPDPGVGTLWGDASADPSTALALDTGSAGNLNAPFVTAALQTWFATAADIDAYFAKRGSATFIDWFNSTTAGRGPWANKAIGSGSGVAANFHAIWDRVPQVFGSARINLLQFLALQSILINEVGGTLAPISERVGTKDHPGLAYAFDRIPGKKRSYNVDGTNWTAFKCFGDPDFVAAHGRKALGSQLQNSTDQRWRGYAYPAGYPTDVDPAVTGFVMEADFYKFRGRGLIQTTWREGYKALVEFIQAYAGAQPAVTSRRQAWAGMTADKAATISTNADWDDLFMNSHLEIACVALAQHNARDGNYLALSGDPDKLNGRDVAGSIWRVGHRISGGTAYADLMRNRVIAMCNALGN